MGSNLAGIILDDTLDVGAEARSKVEVSCSFEKQTEVMDIIKTGGEACSLVNNHQAVHCKQS